MDQNLLLRTIIVSAVIFVVLFIVCLRNVSKQRKRIQDELSGKAGVYGGPAGEPIWNGKLPEKVDDYTEPRYVYENLVESTKYLPENGRIIGYRISPSLVIHSRVQRTKPSSVALYRDRLGGKLLEFSDVKVLVAELKRLSELRVAAGDKPLKGKFLYATDRGSLVICDIVNMMWEYPSNLNYHDNYLLILKR